MLHIGERVVSKFLSNIGDNMKPIEVNEDDVTSIANFTSWERAGISVLREEGAVEEEDRVDERGSKKGDKPAQGKKGDKPDYTTDERKGDKSKTHAGVDDGTEHDYESNLELLEAVLEELSDEELLQHAANMLEVFDAAAEELDLLAEEEDEEGDDEALEEESDEDIENMSPALLRALLKAHREEE
jgi:hypothetical protein